MRQEGSVDSRERILEAALEIFSNEGYGAASVSRVAQEAKVSKALVFWHFESKEKLFQSALERSLEPYSINVASLEGLGAVEKVVHWIDLYDEFVTRNVASIRFVLSLILRNESHTSNPTSRLGELFRVFAQILEEILAAGQAEGEIRPSLDAGAEADLLIAVLNGDLVRRFLEDSTSKPGLHDHLKRLVRERFPA